MTVLELKSKYQKNNPDGHFFDKDTMKHWGDTMNNFGIMKNPIQINTLKGKKAVWVLYRKTVKDCFQQKMFYFDAETFNIVFIHNK